MRVTSLGYNQVSRAGQNYKNNNKPEFKGNIIVGGLEHDSVMLEHTLSQIGHLVRYFAHLGRKQEKDFEYIIKEGNVLKCPHTLDDEAKRVTDIMGTGYANHQVPITLTFTPSAE